MMTKTLLLAIVALLGATINSSAQDCLALAKAHEIFKLREAAASPNASDFCKGAADLSALQLSSGRKHLAGVIRKAPTSPEAYTAHELLAYEYLRTGMYKEFRSEIEASLKLNPSTDDAKQVLPMATVAAQYPDQIVTHFEPSSVQSIDGQIPLTINGKPATYGLDTGANLSVMSENEARRFGMKIEDTSTKIGDSGGLKVGVRIASADDLVIGKTHLKHVLFLILSDAQQPFVDTPEEQRGLIGIPVLIALRSFSYNKNRLYEFGTTKASHPTANGNILFDSANPIVQASSGGKLLAFTLDTGAGNTDLGPVFGKTLPELLSQGKKEPQPSTGFGGTVVRDSTRLAAVQFNLGGKTVTLSPAYVLDDIPLNARLWAAGNLGNDLLNQSEKVTIDFFAMTLVLQ